VRVYAAIGSSSLQERVVRVLEEQGADLIPTGFEGPTPLNTDADYARVGARLNISAYVHGFAVNDDRSWELATWKDENGDWWRIHEDERCEPK